MGRPKASQNQRLMAYQLNRQGFGPTAIHKALHEKFEETETTVSLKTVKNWIRDFKNTDDKIKELDTPFEWHRLQEFGLPWEASDFLLGMWCYTQLNSLLGYENLKGAFGLPAIDAIHWTPTPIRSAIWWWRVHLAAPEIGRDVGTLGDVAVIGRFFGFREQVHEALGRHFDVADLEAWLAWKPWLEEGRNKAYHHAIDRGMIPTLHSEFGELRLLPQHTDLLPSQWRK